MANKVMKLMRARREREGANMKKMYVVLYGYINYWDVMITVKKRRRMCDRFIWHALKSY